MNENSIRRTSFSLSLSLSLSFSLSLSLSLCGLWFWLIDDWTEDFNDESRLGDQYCILLSYLHHDWPRINGPRDDLTRSQEASHLPPFKLEPFNGDFTSPSGQSPHQLSKSSSTTLSLLNTRRWNTRGCIWPPRLSLPTRVYWQTLVNTWRLLDLLEGNIRTPAFDCQSKSCKSKANLAAISNLPCVRPGHMQSLKRFTACLNDAISSFISISSHSFWWMRLALFTSDSFFASAAPPVDFQLFHSLRLV